MLVEELAPFGGVCATGVEARLVPGADAAGLFKGGEV